MRIREYCLLILIVLTTTLPARASRWYPIDTGRLWVYREAGGASHSAAIKAPELFAGSLLQPFQWNSGSREYFSRDEAGRVFFHGVTNPDGSYIVFDPPMLRMDSGLTPGHEWEAITDVISYSSTDVEEWRVRETQSYRVIAVGTVGVLAGSFHAADILVTVERAPLARTTFSSDVSLHSSAPQEASLERRAPFVFLDTYAEGIGWIRRANENGLRVIFELEAYGLSGVSTETSSWGAVKAQFGN